jgi:CRP/FNR family transcriptional regulator, cyclic AMP receptor protein
MTATLGLFRNSPDAVDYAAGQTVFSRGEEAHEMFVVVDGEIDILIGDRIVDTIGPGGLFGELALIDRSPRSATAVARTAARLVPVGERRFTFLLQQTPNFALQVMRVMAERLKRRDPGSGSG